MELSCDAVSWSQLPQTRHQGYFDVFLKKQGTCWTVIKGFPSWNHLFTKNEKIKDNTFVLKAAMAQSV